MKPRIIISLLLISFLPILGYSQNRELTDPLSATESLEFIAKELQEIAKGLDKLNKDINKSYNKIATNMGYKIKDEQRNILVSFEILNKAEVRLSNLRKNKTELLVRKEVLKTKVRLLKESLKDENIERRVSAIGTTNAESSRDRRREHLNSRVNELNNILFELDSEIVEINSDIIQTSRIVGVIKSVLFPAIERELPKLDYFN